jgi:hypothetical protein
MRVFINGTPHPTVISSIPQTGEMYLMTELMAAPQRLRIVPNAKPPALK